MSKKEKIFSLSLLILALIVSYGFYNTIGYSPNIPETVSVKKQLASIGDTSEKSLIKVGPNEQYKKPSEAYEIAKDGDIIEIMSGEYVNDPICIKKNNLTFRGIGGYAHFKAVVLPGASYPPNAPGKGCGGKGTLVIKGNNTIIENIEFSGAKVSDDNGAGIRLEGLSLTVRNSYFHNNQNGILAGGPKDGDILVENTEFAFNGWKDGQSHNMYIGPIKTFTLVNSYSHDSIAGHMIKTRARTNYIIGNRISGENGTGSYNIDISGGRAYVIGNMIEKSANSQNWGTMILFYTTRDPIGPHELYLANNTMVISNLLKRGQFGQFIRVYGEPSIPTFVKAVNNIFVGVPGYTEVSGPNVVMENNLRFNSLTDAPLVNIGAYDYRLMADAEAINAGVNPGSANGFSLIPLTQYVHNSKGEPRQILGPELDIGAYEFTGTPTRLYPLPVITLSVSQSVTDTSSNMTWSSNADTCSASGGWSGNKPTSGTFNTGPISKDTLYTLSCVGRGGTTNQSVTIKPPPPVSIKFIEVNNKTSVPKGTGAYLSWSVSNAASCSASGDWSGPLALSGVYDTRALLTSKIFEITCAGLSGTTLKKSLAISVSEPIVGPVLNSLFLLKAEPNELSSISNEAIVTPNIGPRGILWIKTKGGKAGIVEFLSTPSGQGVHFGPGGQQSYASAFYQFSPPPTEIKNILNENGGEIKATIVGRWNSKERAAAIPDQNNGHQSQYIFSATDGTRDVVSHLSFDMWGKSFVFVGQAPGANGEIKYFVKPIEFFDHLFGKDVSLRVRLTWDGSIQRLYLNDNVVASENYTKQPILWGPDSMFTIGTITNIKFGPGFKALMDILDELSIMASDGSGKTKTYIEESSERPPTPPRPEPPAVASVLGQLRITGDYRANTDCPQNLVEGQTCTITITFKPSAIGDREGTLIFTDPVDRKPRTIHLRGMGSSPESNAQDLQSFTWFKRLFSFVGQIFQDFGKRLAALFLGGQHNNTAAVVLSVSTDTIEFSSTPVDSEDTKTITITLYNITNTSPPSSGTGNNDDLLPPVKDGPDATDGVEPSDNSNNTGGGGGGGSSGGGGEGSVSSSGITSVVSNNVSNNSASSPSSPNAGSIKVPSFVRPLSRGSVGEDVRALQKFLNAEGFFVTILGEETDLFGPGTELALKLYQEKYRDLILTPNNLIVGTGILGNTTIQFINSLNTNSTQTSELPSISPNSITRSLSYGIRGNDVLLLQRYLISKNHLSAGSDTGFYGSLTRVAVRKLQCSKKIICTGNEISTGWGLVGPKTRKSLE